MYTAIRPTHQMRNLLVNMSSRRSFAKKAPKIINKSSPPKKNPHSLERAKWIIHKKRIIRELRSLGASEYGLLRLPVRHLPHVIHPDEKIRAVVYGRHENGSAVLVATDRRALFVNKKLTWVDEDEVTYDVVAGVDYRRTGFGSTVTLHTRVKDYKVGTFNEKCAKNFVEYIETRCLDQGEDRERGVKS